MSRKVIELIRVSTEGQAASDRASIPAQRAINRRTAAAYGLEIVKSIEMSDVSGAAVLFAPEIQELLRLISDPNIHGVVAREFSRLMRPENFSDYGLLQQFADTNTILYLPEGPIDFGSKTGRLLGTIRAAIAGMERTEILERIWSAKEEKRKQGKFAQSKIVLPFGVGYEESRGWFYTSEAERIRKAFKMLLSGETGYTVIGKAVGIDPYSLRVMLRNPIYTGWRVIDKRRDPSPGARKVKADGRQKDRPKIKRAPEDVIRVKVIDEPLITEAEFARAQQIMEMKKAHHWRRQGGNTHRFTYNGFLTCAECGEPMYNKYQRADYYECRSRYFRRGCKAAFMRRDIVDPSLDALFFERLTDRDFLAELVSEFEKKSNVRESEASIARAQAEIIRLEARRQRVLDSFFDGVINVTERDMSLARIDDDLRTARNLLFSVKPERAVDVDTLAALFQPFFEWEFLGRDDKRRILAVVVPEIKIANYQVRGLWLNLDFSHEITRTDTDSWHWRA